MIFFLKNQGFVFYIEQFDDFAINLGIIGILNTKSLVILLNIQCFL